MWLNRNLLRRPTSVVAALLLVVGVISFWKIVLADRPARALHSQFFGRLPKPTEPGLVESVTDTLRGEVNYVPMRVQHIPNIRLGQPMPHPYVGACINCHLMIGGAAAGSQFKTPYGAVLEKLSENVVKLGPPIKPTSHRPHPPAGRCIKCHDIVVQVPVRKSPFIWEK